MSTPSEQLDAENLAMPCADDVYGSIGRLHVADVCGVPIHAITMDEAVDLAMRAVAGRTRLRIGVVNGAKLVNMRSDAELDEDVRSSNLILADGMSVVWAASMLRDRLPERIPGIDLMHALMARGAKEGGRFYFLGAREEVCADVAARAPRDYPGLVSTGYQNGYFDAADEAEIVAEINRCAPDVLFVAMTSPKKERFMGKWADSLEVPVIHGVGGSFDVYAGLVTRAPMWMQRMGLEWLHRVLKEPKRLWRRYLVTNTKFAFYLFRQLLRL